MHAIPSVRVERACAIACIAAHAAALCLAAAGMTITGIRVIRTARALRQALA